ncbi:MAG: FAD-binding oxidoreductase [Burkholderiaceae bacterium]
MSAHRQLSWGGYPPHPQHLHDVVWRDQLRDRFGALINDHGQTLAFGNGRSYGDCCMAASDHVLHTRGLDRIIAFDAGEGTVTAEAGCTLEQILELAIPHGWFLPVTPGTCFVTLGGAVANDVHGKNHHVRGTFGNHVDAFGLVRSDAPPMICSPASNPSLFHATIGGLGLTGAIEWVSLRLMPIRSSRLDTLSVRFDSLDEFFALSDEHDPRHEYTVSWVDCCAKGARLGRGVFMAANHANDGGLQVSRRNKLMVPITPPLSLVNRLTLKAFNHAYYHAHPAEPRQSRIDYEPFFYPLDRILHWNRIYGPSGFQQYQCVLPEPDGRDAIRQMLDAIAQSATGSFLAVLKRCGDARSPGLLSFPMAGVSLALDFPHKPKEMSRLFERLDAIVEQARGRLYPAKDAHMSGAAFRKAYPAYSELARYKDPALTSRFWQRVTET